MKKMDLKSLIPHFIAIAVFTGITLVYFSPILEGKKLYQTDKVNYIGMSKEIKDHRAEYGEEPLWTNSMFGGMPAYQISTLYGANLVRYIDKLFQGFLPRPAGLVFLYLIGFYILLMSLKIDYRLAIFGAIAFAFSSYFFIILEAGHNTKAHAIGYMAPLLASVLMTIRGKWLTGGVLTALFTSLILYANHLQITYYLVMLFFILGMVKLIEAVKENHLKSYLKSVVVLLLAGLLGASTNITRILTTAEYGEESMRGKSELTNDLHNKTSGLDKDYVTNWSYGKAESFTLLIPNFHGGSSMESFLTNKESKTYNSYINYRPKNQLEANQLQQLQQNTVTYWGAQPFTSGPVYAGAIVCFLFIVGLFLIKGYMRWWVIITTILMLTLSWGKNFMPLTDLFLDYFPGYNKFRAVSTTLVIVEFLLPLLAFVGLHKLLGNSDKIESKKAIKWGFIISGGLCFLFALMPTIILSFEGVRDVFIPEKFYWLLDAIQSDRASLLSADAWRSFIFILMSATVLWLYLRKNLKKQYVIFIVGLLIVGDMWTVNKRYLDNGDFQSETNFNVAEPFKPTNGDIQILLNENGNLQEPYSPKDLNKIVKNKGFSYALNTITKQTDPNFRVFNKVVNTFNDASTSFYHKSIGGYHGAKLKRYQELIDAHIDIEKENINKSVLNMLNTKYVIEINQKKQIELKNHKTEALGNAWFIKEIQLVANADEELAALSAINTAEKAVVDIRYEDMITNFNFDSLASIQLTNYKANHLTYTTNCNQEQFAVFSEIFYDKGWNAYLNGELVPHFRANYVLRAMSIPAGNNQIEFKFEPTAYNTGERISFAGSTVLLLLLLGVAYTELKA